MDDRAEVAAIETMGARAGPGGAAAGQDRSPVTTHDDVARLTDALDVLIEQERQLITRFEARQSSAESAAAAAVTAALALSALAATGAKTISQIDQTFAWIVAGVFAAIPVIALGARFLAGLHLTSWGLSSRSKKYKKAVKRLHKCGSTQNRDPIHVRKCVLSVCRARAKDAEATAEAKERWAALASGALAAAVTLTVILAFVSLS